MKKINKRIAILIGILIILYFKNLIFISISSSYLASGFSGISFDISTLLPHLAILGIIVFPALFFKNKGFIKYLIAVDILYSLLLVCDLSVFRGTGYFMDLKYIVYKDLFNVLNNSIFNIRIIDLIFFIDVVCFGLMYFKLRDSIIFDRKNITGAVSIIICLTLVFGWHYLFDIKRVAGSDIRFVQNDWEVAWSPVAKMTNRSPLAHHIYEGYLTINKEIKNDDEEEMKEVDEWLAWNDEKLPDNEFKGIAKGKNVIFLQIESLENFVINQKVYGQEITPNINRLISKGLYFDNVYEQNNAANSIDADFMLNTGILPLGDKITALNYPEVKFNSFPRMLEKQGYTTITTHAEKLGDWSWAELHKGGFGVQNIWDINQYNVDEYVGFGLSDRSLYTQFAKKISEVKEPFYGLVPTLTSHGPFDIKDEYRYLDLPEELDKTKLGGYFQSINYADKQIGLFIDLLEEQGLMDNTIIAIYGDHGGIHKYYINELKDIQLEGNWWQDYTKEIPFVIYGKDMPSKTINTIGGHIDIVPTVAYLLDINTNNTIMGRNLLNTNRNATVIKGNEIIGEPSKEEREHLEKAYKIADYIIKNSYFENRGYVN